MSLAGKRIVNTRAVHQAAALDALLRAHGAIPLAYPCIAIAPPDDAALDAALRHQFDLLVLTSVNTVLILQERLAARGVSLNGIRAACVGTATADAARERLGVEVGLIPDEFSADALAAALALSPGMRVLLPQSEIARPALAAALRARGADVTAVTAYRTVCGRGGVNLVPLLRAGEVDAVAFTSSSTVRCFVERLRDEGGDLQDLTGVAIACIGAQTRQTAEACGLTAAVTPETFSLEDLAGALAGYFQEQPL